MPTICAIGNQLVIDVVNMLICHFERGHYEEVRVYLQNNLFFSSLNVIFFIHMLHE